MRNCLAMSMIDAGRSTTFRHDFVSASRYLAELLDDPPAEKVKTPMTVVVTDDDPVTDGFAERFAACQLVAEQVDVSVLTDGGHYFPRTRPVETADVVVRDAGVVPPAAAEGR